MNPLMYRGLGKSLWLNKTLPAIQDPVDAMVTNCGESRRVVPVCWWPGP